MPFAPQYDGGVVIDPMTPSQPASEMPRASFFPFELRSCPSGSSHEARHSTFTLNFATNEHVLPPRQRPRVPAPSL